VRISVLVFSIIVGIMATRRGLHTPRAILLGIGAWIFACVPLLAQSWIAFVAAAARDLPLQHALDASRALGVVLTNSYWSNFQADRFFAGIGNQVEIAASFSAAAFCIVLAAKILFTLNARTMMPLLRRIFERSSLLIVSPFIAGFLIGLRGLRLNWNGLDILSVVLTIVVFLSWFAWKGLRVERKDIADFCLLFALVGGFVLGWPALALVLALILLEYIASARLRAPVMAVSAGLLAALGGTVALRSAVLTQGVFDILVIWGLLTAAMIIFEKKIDSWLRYGFFVFIGLGWALTLIRFGMNG